MPQASDETSKIQVNGDEKSISSRENYCLFRQCKGRLASEHRMWEKEGLLSETLGKDTMLSIGGHLGILSPRSSAKPLQTLVHLCLFICLLEVRVWITKYSRISSSITLAVQYDKWIRVSRYKKTRNLLQGLNMKEKGIQAELSCPLEGWDCCSLS